MRTAAMMDLTAARVVVGCLQPATREKRTAPKRTEATAADGPSRAALMLALAHYMQRQIDRGELTNQATAAKHLRVTRARLSQILDLLLLAPDIQEQIVIGDASSSERDLRNVTATFCWKSQRYG